ncbi:P-loop containing nucleoside triphosphate hydrolase protein [Gamsiella multidivaricata]|uniref:P-loop containing nucleoside triphosphate hydrolase protein n=1 Tax=Gamsiella multidivaricata TaxID=101098 RepID=UPI002220D759|nr:P-loop containing nucleoside triphosphate hydrolase protein [Gamsiella multidivaricata]KAI7818546.1 P-loop containing nucleoside triphosphate hydrolase protein [Gamsiella multidivaricata]
MRSLHLPSNDDTQRLEQAFQLIFQSSQRDYCQLCRTFRPLGGLPQAWMIKGDSGAGKTYLGDALCKKYGVQYTVTITIGELAVMYPGDMLKGLKTYLGSIKYHAKSVVILDNIELLFPREDGDFALVYAFQSWIQDLADQESVSQSVSSADVAMNERVSPRVMVLGLTQDSRGLDPSIASLFDDSIELDIPTPKERYVILKTCMVNHNMTIASVSLPVAGSEETKKNTGSIENRDPLEMVSMKCHGYLAADLDTLCIQASVVANRHGRGMDQLAAEDFLEAMKSIKVSALRQSASAQKVDPVRWSDIGGLEDVKKTLEESVIWLYKHAEAYTRMGISPSKGVLLYGPPGTGKTLLAKAVATESEANFMAVLIPDLIKGEVGESEKAIAKVFRMATRCSPCIVFLDELEAIFGTRESSGGLGKQLISQLLLEMDNCGEGVVILAATNHPEAIDASILRPGRLDRLVYVPPPTFDERVAILQILKGMTQISNNVDLRTVSNLSNNFTGADMKALVRKAGLFALKANRTSIEAQDFFAAASEVQPSVSQFGLLRYQQFHR